MSSLPLQGLTDLNLRVSVNSIQPSSLLAQCKKLKQLHLIRHEFSKAKPKGISSMFASLPSLTSLTFEKGTFNVALYLPLLP
jgi:hypothetical protein